MENLYSDKKVIISFDLGADYFYSSNDLVYFKSLRLDRNVFVLIKTDLNLECNCTIMWLLFNTRTNSTIKSMQSKTLHKCLEPARRFYDSLRKCDFDSKIKPDFDVKSKIDWMQKCFN